MRKKGLVFCCQPDNDLYKVMIENGYLLNLLRKNKHAKGGV